MTMKGKFIAITFLTLTIGLLTSFINAPKDTWEIENHKHLNNYIARS